MNRARTVVAAALLLHASGAHAYRPFDGTDADVAELYELEIELGPLGWVSGAGDSALVVPAVVLNLGIAPGWELVVTGRNSVDLGAGHADRLTDTGAFLKGILREGVLQGRTGLSVASELGVLLPTFNDEPGFGASAALITSYQWAALSLHLNLEMHYTRSRTLELSSELIAEGPMAWRVRPAAELLVAGDLDASVSEASALLGVLCPVGEHFVFDTAARVVEVNGVVSFEVRAGLTVAFSVATGL